MTRTYASLEISRAAFEEIKERLRLIAPDPDVYIKGDLLDMSGIALKAAAADDELQVFIVHRGRYLTVDKNNQVTLRDRPPARSCPSCGCRMKTDGTVVRGPGRGECGCECHQEEPDAS